MRKIATTSERFWPKVRQTETCWEWTGSRTGQGYGYMHFGPQKARKPKTAHRVSWEFHFGPIPDGLWVLHKSDNRLCVRPDHLFLGDRVANMKDCAAKGRVSTIGKSNLTHCKRGHEFTPDNTYIRANGHRRCKACNALYAIRARTGEKL